VGEESGGGGEWSSGGAGVEASATCAAYGALCPLEGSSMLIEFYIQLQF